MVMKQNGWVTPLILVLLLNAGANGQSPPPLPRYGLKIKLEPVGHRVELNERVTWTNPGPLVTDQLVFNVHSHFKLPDKDVGMTAKMFEILRMMPGETLDLKGRAGNVQQVRLVQPAGDPRKPSGSPLVLEKDKKPEEQILPFSYQEENDSALVIPLPFPVHPGESVTIDLDFVLELPQLQGRWGQWQGVTTLNQWMPLLAYYDARGWHPTPFIPWHQPFYNEAGHFQVRLNVPTSQKIAATSRILEEREISAGRKEVVFADCCARDYSILASDRYQEYVGECGSIRVRCLAFAEHEYYARFIVQSASEALAVFAEWFGPYPYPQFTIAESFFGWHTNECGGLLMIDERIFQMPRVAGSFVDFLVASGTCHQWWYNIVGTNGHAETWMDEGVSTYFAYRLMQRKHGKNNYLLQYPKYLKWMPNVQREDFRHLYLYGTLARGEAAPTIQELHQYGHLANVYSMCYERGGKIVGILEDRLGEEQFLAFMRSVVTHHHFRMLRVADFQKELENFTHQDWQDFFNNWIYGKGMADWSIQDVTLQEQPVPSGSSGEDLNRSGSVLYKTTVIVQQKADFNEPTTVGFRFDANENYQLRIPVIPAQDSLDIKEIPARVTRLADNRFQIDVVLSQKPTQIAVDPDQILVDPNPANNFWKSTLKVHFTPLYTFLDETDLTNAYDRWNLIAGPWIYAPTYDNPFFTRSSRFGGRAGLYRTSCFDGGVYSAYRTDYRDIVVGADLVLDRLPLDHTELGMVFERRLVGTLKGETDANIGVLYGRYIIDYGDSLYLPPFHYVEGFTTIQDDLLPQARETVPGAERYQHQGLAGLHYHLNYLTPYWDAEGGIATDISYAQGVEIPGEGRSTTGSQQVTGQVSYVQSLPDGLGWFSDTRFAFRAYGAMGLPSRIQYYALGGSEIFRGFDLAQRQGNALWVGSVEWRVPILRHLNWGCCDHAIVVRNVYGAAFCDVGDVFLNGQNLGGITESVGTGLRLDLSWFTFVERTILRLDVAKAINVATSPQYWIALEHPF